MEVLCAVVDILASPKSGAPVPLDRNSKLPMALLKPHFKNLRALSCVSRKMRLTVLAAWYRTLYIRNPEDWDLAVRMQICGYVLEVRVLAVALDMKRPFSTTILARFPRLHTVFIDAHNDIVPRRLAKDDPTLKLLVAHPSRKYFSMLPRLIWPDTLRRLWITNTHFDTQLIPNISSMCPNLEDLWISRCTIFSRNVSGPERLCNFWDGDVTRHEQYFFLEPRVRIWAHYTFEWLTEHNRQRPHGSKLWNTPCRISESFTSEATTYPDLLSFRTWLFTKGLLLTSTFLTHTTQYGEMFAPCVPTSMVLESSKLAPPCVEDF
ncbi:hypothetical protein FRC08_007403 [Ceratobasidium sp. 394]|nr:hypothetical protein FRC08_007403 [Ceratobasidium sp. 394]